MTTKHRIFTTSFASVYPLYVAKAEKKGRKKSEVDAVICWLTGYNQRELEGQLKKQKDFETFFKEAPRLNPSRSLIKGVNLRRSSGRPSRADDAGNTLSGQIDR
jgi:hypothetical protein